MFFALFHNSVQAGQNATLAWDPSSDPTVVGYHVYSGTVSRTYTKKVDVGNTTSSSIPGLTEGVTYFFAVTAYDALGLESNFSDEISYTALAASPTVQIRVGTGKSFTLTVTGPIGHAYVIEATEDFTTWTIISTVTLGVFGSWEFTDPNAESYSHRFYRTREIQP